jgi:tryptophan synthase alpha subunit
MSPRQKSDFSTPHTAVHTNIVPLQPPIDRQNGIAEKNDHIVYLVTYYGTEGVLKTLQESSAAHNRAATMHI